VSEGVNWDEWYARLSVTVCGAVACGDAESDGRTVTGGDGAGDCDRDRARDGDGDRPGDGHGTGDCTADRSRDGDGTGVGTSQLPVLIASGKKVAVVPIVRPAVSTPVLPTFVLEQTESKTRKLFSAIPVKKQSGFELSAISTQSPISIPDVFAPK
jgi:hypothetical protein